MVDNSKRTQYHKLSQHIHLHFLLVWIAKIIIHICCQNCLCEQNNSSLGNKTREKHTLQVMGTSSLQVKKEVKLQTHFLTPGIDVPRAEYHVLIWKLHGKKKITCLLWRTAHLIIKITFKCHLIMQPNWKRKWRFDYEWQTCIQ